MFIFNKVSKSLSSEKIRNCTPYLIFGLLLVAIIIPVWANTPTDVSTLDELKTAFANGGNYKLVADITSDTTVEGSKDITLDLNSHKLSRTNITADEKGDNDRTFIRIYDGTLTLKNSGATDGEIYAKAATDTAAPRAVTVGPSKKATNQHAKIIIGDGVKLTAEGCGNQNTGTYALAVFSKYEKKSDTIDCTAEAEINGGSFCSYGKEHAYVTSGKAVMFEGYGVTGHISGGTFNAEWSSVLGCYCGAKVTINGGNFSTSLGADSGVRVKNAFLTINNGTFDISNSGFVCRSSTDLEEYPYAYDKGNIKIYGGNFTGGTPRSSSDAYIQIYGGAFNFDPTGYSGESETHFNGLIVGSASVAKSGWDHNVTNDANKAVSSFDGATDGLKLLEKGGTFKLASNITIPKNGDAITMQKDVAVDLNGHKISKQSSLLRSDDTSAKNIFSVEDGTFTVNNSAATEGEIYGDAVDQEFAVIRGIRVMPKSNDGSSVDGVAGCHPKAIVNSGVKITVTGSPLNESGGGAGMSRGIGVFTDASPNTKERVICTAEAEINGATIKSGNNGISTDGYGTYLTVNSGNIEGGRHGIGNNRGETIIKDATVKGGITNALYNCKGILQVHGGTFTAGAYENSNVIYNDADVEKYYSETGNTTFMATAGTFNGAIINNTDETQGTAKILLSGGKYTADPTAYLGAGATAAQSGKYYVVKQSSGSYQVTTDKEGEIPGQTITAKIKIRFENLQSALITGIQAVVNYATDILELVSAQKSDIQGAYDPETSIAGEVGFGLMNMGGVSLNEGQYYDFGTMTFRVKQGVSVGATSNISITNAIYMLANFQETSAATTDASVEVYQPVTSINVTSQTGETEMSPESTLQLSAAVLPDNAHNKDLQWTSSNENVATVDANGLVTSKALTGQSASVTITATALDGSGVHGSIQLTVRHIIVTEMHFAQASYELVTDQSTKDLYAELSVVPAQAIKPAANKITWQSSNPNFAIDANGVISIVTPTQEQQSTTVTAKYTNEDSQLVTATCTVSSKAPKLNLNLATKLEGRQSGGGTGTNVEQIEVWLYDSTNHPLWNGTGTTDANGNVSFEIEADALEEGKTVKLWIKGERYLAKLLTQTVTLSGSDWNVTMPEKLKGADAETENSYNSVELRDFLVLRKSFAKDKGETGYDRRADFDNNDAVELADFLILRRNFTVEGDKKPQAALTLFMTAAARKGSLNTAMEVMNSETAKVAEEALANSTATDEETQEEEILYAVQNATGANLKASKPAAATAESASNSNESSGSGNSSGGCNAGYCALALMFAIPLIFKKRK